MVIMEMLLPLIQLRRKKERRLGTIVWLDSRPVILYPNDLFCDVPEDIIYGTSDEAVKCVHGLVDIQRWLGSESFHRTTLRAPAIVVAYNYFMNGVDRMDQQRAVNTTKWKEQHVGMSIFTWAIDMACHNAYVLLKKLLPSLNISLREYKRQLVVALTEPQKNTTRKNEEEDEQPENSITSQDKTIGGRRLIKNQCGKCSRRFIFRSLLTRKCKEEAHIMFFMSTTYERSFSIR